MTANRRFGAGDTELGLRSSPALVIAPPTLPPPAGPGDRVGVAALSGPVDPERLERGLAELRRLGFVPVLADNLASRDRFLAGSDAERLASFHRLAADRDLPAIFFARGGHGVLRILPGIDWQLLARHPRAYVGYSDLTPFLHGVVARLGLAAFHGPLVAADLARGLLGEEEASLLDGLAGRYPQEVPCAALRAGEAAGPLLGGCLSLLAATVGTPYFPDLDGALLFFEDVGEAEYRLDRLLTHLTLSDSLRAIVGMLIGHLDAGDAVDSCPAGQPESGRRPTGRPGTSWGDHAFSAFSGPVAEQLPAGHRRPNRTLPLGLLARLSAGDPADPAHPEGRVRLTVGESSRVP
jgi:muramoyltetrapeptide carboxypeptidase